MVVAKLPSGLWGASAFAQNAVRKASAEPADARARASWAMQAPASSNIILEVKDAARLRGSPVGRAVHDLISRVGLLGDTRLSWDELAKTLGWQREETFDKLLGDRFMIVISGSITDPGAGPVRWAVLSRVSEETDKRLIDKLAAAPRQNAAGHELLSVERGSYELAIHRPEKGQAGDRVIVLGPRARPELLDQVLRLLNDAPAPGESAIFATSAAASMGELGEADAVMLVRLDPENPNDPAVAQDGWAVHAALAVRADDTGMALRCILSDPSAAEYVNANAGGASVDLDAAFTGALIAIVDRERDSLVSEVLKRVQIAEPLQQSLETGEMIVMVASPAPPGVAAGLAVRMKDPLGSAREADAFMSGLARQVEGEARRDGCGPAPDFEGAAARAVRTIPVNAWSSFAWFAWPDLWMSWSYATDVGNAGAAGGTGGGGGTGWWAMAVAGGTADEVGAGRALANDLVAQLHAATLATGRGRVLSQGVIRPAALAKAVVPAVPDLANWREVFGRVNSVKWRVEGADGGRMDGVVRVELAPSEKAMPAPGQVK